MADSVLVIGASGFQGGAVARTLMERGYNVTAAARRTEKLAPLTHKGATAVQLDLTEAKSVAEAARGVDYAFFHAPMGLAGPGTEDAEENALSALLDAGVRHIAFNVGFALPPEPVGAPHLDGRIHLVNKLLETGRCTVFVPTGYLENFVAPWSAPVVLEGKLKYPLSPEVRVAWVTNEDVGAATAAAFQTPEAAGKRLRVAGPEILTLPEVAERIGKALGHGVTFEQINGPKYAEMLAPFLGEQTAQMIGQSYDKMANDQNPLMTPDTSETRALLGVKFTSVYDWARRQDWTRASKGQAAQAE